MRTIYSLRVISGIVTCFFFNGLMFSQSSNTKDPQAVDRSSSSLLYSGGGISDPLARISHHQKLIDDKNYEISTAIRIPSINGGDQIDRELNEKSRKISENQFRVDRTVKALGPNGKLSTMEMLSEDHQTKGQTEEIQRSYYRPDINGKMIAHSVESETITRISVKEKQTTRASYRPDLDGKFSLSELEEGSEKKVSDTLTIKESSHKIKESSGKLAVADTSRETTTKLSEGSFRKETVIQKAGESGRLSVTDKLIETQTESPDGTKKYQRLLESRNINSQIRNVNSTGLILSQRVTGEERRLSDGSIETKTQVETLDPFNLSNGLRVTELITEISRPMGNGKVSVERVVKTRDVNGNFTLSQRIAQTVEATK